MKRTLLNSKIHRATVTRADLNYIGSISIDADLLESANILPFEKVQVVNLNNGARWETYAIAAPAGSGAIEVNGAGARLVQNGDLVIVMSYVEIEDSESAGWNPRLLMMGEQNEVAEVLTMDRRGHAAPAAACA